jgi:hypothetical protein
VLIFEAVLRSASKEAGRLLVIVSLSSGVCKLDLNPTYCDDFQETQVSVCLIWYTRKFNTTPKEDYSVKKKNYKAG